MTKPELINRIAEKASLSKKDAAAAVTALIATITETLQAGEKIAIPSLGSFEVRECAARTGKNPRTGESVAIGFKTADIIAGKLGIEKERFIRLRSGLLYTLNKLAEDGHCYGTQAQLLETGAKLLEVDESLLSMTLDEMVRTMM